MTHENKELLLKDLCARLLYGVMLSITHNEYTGETFNARMSTIDYCGEVKVRYGFEKYGYEQAFSLEQIKPYLFPLSSMTEEQDKEFALLQTSAGKEGFIYMWNCATMMQWLIENHFDYNNLIPKGLANDATGLNIY